MRGRREKNPPTRVCHHAIDAGIAGDDVVILGIMDNGDEILLPVNCLIVGCLVWVRGDGSIMT